MKNRKGWCFLLGLAAMTLCGCSLAVPGEGEAEADRLIGAFITTEYLDLFDMEAYLNDHVSSLAKQAETVITDTSGYEGKLYADIDRSSADWKVTFGDIDGICFLSPVCTDEDGERYWGNVSDEGIRVTDVDVAVSDTEESRSLRGTIYVSPQREDEIGCYVNPVYQTADGKIYAVTGNGCSMGAEEGSMTTTLEEKTDVTEGGRAKTEKYSVAVTIETGTVPEKITLYQMDAEHEILKKEVFVPGSLPESITPDAQTTYILVETQKEGSDGETQISREIYEYQEEAENVLTAFYPLEAGNILSFQEVEINWEKAAE